MCNWTLAGNTKGFRRASAKAYQPNAAPKLVFTYSLQRNARRLLSQSKIPPTYQCGVPRLMLTVDQMGTLPGFFRSIPDPRRARFDCYYKNTTWHVPSESIIRDVLIRTDPEALDLALRQWSARYALEDESLAIDGKTMCNATDADGKQTHIMGVVGHDSLCSYTQKKSAN